MQMNLMVPQVSTSGKNREQFELLLDAFELQLENMDERIADGTDTKIIALYEREYERTMVAELSVETLIANYRKRGLLYSDAFYYKI